MSHIIASAAVRGAHKLAKKAEEMLTKAVAEKGADCVVEFPNTGYFIPIIYAMTGREVKILSDFQEVMKEIKDLLPAEVD
ncbi:MAG: CO dehydrogenase/CO-methylating acetyl-CoA synthase complex subunit beta, partial [Planctomycetes bacterium]|nr:CO dehydrogenase/CO-methylating acetyl-CoA synthase complex subunit beta [Planctomycetota bacterium]